VTGPYCPGCGKPMREGVHVRCRTTTDPPRYCMRCGRKLAVQVLPTGYTSRCVRCQ
jgi:hypothetical protein